MSEHDNIWSKKTPIHELLTIKTDQFSIWRKWKSQIMTRNIIFLERRNVFLEKLEGKVVEKKQEKISCTYVLMGRHHLCYRWLDWGNRDLGNERTGWILEIEIEGAEKKKEREEIINGKERTN